MKKRSDVARCSVKFATWCVGSAYLSCEACDFDLCQECFKLESLEPSEKAAMLNKMYAEKAREEAAAKQAYKEEQRREEERRRQEEIKRKQEYPLNIREPSQLHLDASKKLKYSVWMSCGYDCDGWHSYDGPPPKEFESSFDTIEEANQCVEYVFYFMNPWGRDFDDMEHLESFEDSVSNKGFRRLEVRPDDCERFTVSVAPSEVIDYEEDERCSQAIDYY